MTEKKHARCGNCAHLNRKERNDIGGMLIARCEIPGGTSIEGVSINGDWVEMNSRCDNHLQVK